MNNHIIIVLVGESGSGKTSIEKKLWDLNYKKVISYTTRNIRKNELDKIDYNFISMQQFLNMIDNNELIEYTNCYNNYYGIGIDSFDITNNDYVCTVDLNGYLKLKSKYKNNVVGIYVDVDEEERERRLIKRDGICSETNSRIKETNNIKNQFEYSIFNKSLDNSISQIINIIKNYKEGDMFD